jgi:2-oxo-3-hexenedioate decarboxylase
MLLDGEIPLSTAMALSAGESLHIDGFTGPKVSAHLAVVLEEDLHGSDLTAARTLIAVEAVFGALLVTDGSDAPTHYLTGPAAAPVNDVDLMLEGCLLEVDGQIVDSATAAAVRPVETLARVARRRLLLSGNVLLTAALTEPVTIRAKQRVAAHFSTLGTLTVAVR